MERIVKHDDQRVARPKIPGPDEEPLIPDGEYVVQPFAAIVFSYFGDLRLRWCTEIVDPPVGGENRISARYTVRRFGDNDGMTPKPGAPNPEFVAGWKSRIARDIGTLHPELARFDFLRPMRLPRDMLGDRLVRVCVRKVTQDSEKVSRPDCLHYSVIDHVVGWADEKPASATTVAERRWGSGNDGSSGGTHPCKTEDVSNGSGTNTHTHRLSTDEELPTQEERAAELAEREAERERIDADADEFFGGANDD